MQGYSSGDTIPFIINADATSNAPTLVVKNLADGYVLNFGDHAFQASASAYTVATLTLSGNQWAYLYDSTGLAATTVNAVAEYTIDGDVYTDDLPLNYSAGGGGDATKAIQLAMWRDLVAIMYLGIQGTTYPLFIADQPTLTAGQSITLTAMDVVASGDTVVLQTQQVLFTIDSTGTTDGPDWSPGTLSCSALQLDLVNTPAGRLEFGVSSYSAGDYTASIAIDLPAANGTFWIGTDGALLGKPDESGQVIPGTTPISKAVTAELAAQYPSIVYGREQFWHNFAKDRVSTAGWTPATVAVTFSGSATNAINLYDAQPSSTDAVGFEATESQIIGSISGTTFTPDVGFTTPNRLLGIIMTGAVTPGTLTITHTDGASIRTYAVNIPAMPISSVGVFVDSRTGDLVGVDGARINTPEDHTSAETQAACAAALAAYPAATETTALAIQAKTDLLTFNAGHEVKAYITSGSGALTKEDVYDVINRVNKALGNRGTSYQKP